MWTNIFRIGGLQQVSWFQFLPSETDIGTLRDKSGKIEDRKDAATFLVLSAHAHLQNEDSLSTWTNSFVGPWDPSQGIHNPDEKIKLWLFLPGRQSNIGASAQAAVSGLKVVGAGLWSAPGDSEEVAVALSQALRNRIERAFRGLNYMRFGDVFVKCQSFGQDKFSFRKPLLTCELIFSASEEAIFVHVVVSAKRVQTLSSDDMEGVLRQHSRSNGAEERIAVFVAPHGMRGRLTGCCPGDLVRQLYQSKMKASNDFSVNSLPFHFSQCSHEKIRGQNCYAEVSLGCVVGRAGRPTQVLSNMNKNGTKQDDIDIQSCNMLMEDERKQACEDNVQLGERTFIYPVEAVLVPMMPIVLARTFLRRCWLRDWAGTSWLENSLLADMSCTSSSISGSTFCINDGKESLESSWIGSNGLHQQNSTNSNSSSSSSSSSTSSTTSSSESDIEPGIVSGDLEADADSLASKQSHLTSAVQMDMDGSKLLHGGKRGRSSGADLISEAATAKSARKGDSAGPDVSGLVGEKSVTGMLKSGGTLTELNAVGISSTTAAASRSPWDWPDDDRSMGMEIQTVLAEFGDFGDFFEDDTLAFGEPPGTAESFMLSLADCGDGVGSPDVRGLETSDQMLLPVLDFSSLDGFSQDIELVKEDAEKDSYKDARSSQAGSQSSGLSLGEVDSLPKAEAMMMFAPEYTPVETTRSELTSSLFRSPYIPDSRKERNIQSSSNGYVYSATPPPSPCIESSDQKPEYGGKGNGTCKIRNDTDIQHELKKHYRHVQSGKLLYEKPSSTNNSSVVQKRDLAFPSISQLVSTKLGMSVQLKCENDLGAGGLLMGPRTVLATEIECAMLQAAMCRIRHVLMSSNNIVRLSSNRLTVGTSLDRPPNASHFHESNIPSGKVSVKQMKESIPVRIAGDADEEMHDGPRTALVGVWRPVGAPKASKAYLLPKNENVKPSPYNVSEEESVVSNTLKQPLHELLDAMSFLVQQATASTDISLDGECGDGPFAWLAFQEQQRRRFSCGPAMVHAGCGGSLATCHFLDGSGVELIDPLVADVSPAAVLSLLQSDVRAVIKKAFEDSSSDGPLSIIDWCKGRVQLGEGGHAGDSSSGDCALNDSKEATSTIGDPITPPQCSAVGSVNLKGTGLQQIDNQISEVQRGSKNWGIETLSMSEGMRLDDSSQRRTALDAEGDLQMGLSRNRPTLMALSVPALLVGYQDDWLKTSTSPIQLWEKAPLEPYAPPKPVAYYVICPNIDLLLSESADFFQQLSTVYEACKLGSHDPVNTEGQRFNSGKWASSGVVPVECPAQFQKTVNNLSFIGSINDYLMTLEKGWDVSSFCRSLAKVLKSFPIGANSPGTQKDTDNGPFTVLYVICPFAEPGPMLQTIVEACRCLGAIVNHPDKERRSITYSHVGKSLHCATTLDETLNLNVPTLFGFSVPKLVLQVLTAETILKATCPPVSELVTLKEIAFTVYNKARRIPRYAPVCDTLQAATPSLRARPGAVHMSPSVTGFWKDCSINRATGASSLSRENALDTSCLRPGAWDSSWQTRHSESTTCDLSGSGDSISQNDVCYLFEPLFILSEPGSLSQGVSLHVTGTATSDSLRTLSDDASGSTQPSTASVLGDIGSSIVIDGSESDCLRAGNHRAPSLHCCYGWTEDWQWLICVWTDARGELLDVHIFPFGGIGSRQDTKGLESLFIQVLQQGCQLLSVAPDVGGGRPRSLVIARIGCFYELECQEWQKAISAVGGDEMKKWPVQLRRFAPDGTSASSGGSTIQPQEINMIHDRTLPPSPSTASSIYGSHSKTSNFIKGNVGQPNTRKQVISGHSQEFSKGAFHWVQNISLVGLCIDHSLQLLSQVEATSLGGNQGASSGISGSIDGLNPVNPHVSTTVSNLFVPSHNLRFFPPMPLQLPTCLTSESPPLVHLLHSKGFAFPFATGFVVSKTTPSIRKDSMQRFTKEEWPSTLMVNLVDYYGGTNTIPTSQQVPITAEAIGKSKQSRIPIIEAKDYQVEAHLALECVAAELHALSWLSVSPAFLDRRTALPLHCDMVQRLRRLIHYASKEFGLSGMQERMQSVL
ncbi:mediator of RNA polymerase II transcription subunit 13 isoform X1 [Cryptomeria japonica]|uniref:mediator of RNA polymerase II transcription subunit 13 isoform X1 n=2 Tax=Cryptomeria japonica TaxID=3369 RepID=UPI0027D9FB51|nr:mediator of RNA polymerase II transcription subunit 13 isoform X1 [Cryptomeria japonica]XP_057837001.2 mediator of RNA polymerase II transcription subunit 13 isoform X1 [Cryptomeria japonica]XP_057837007.2 mediator of RNA polymerase II transcription subunit 13 isoform X1 [Cryptomeria japonica]XP_059075813.1 mediator of RNA polymerase II transcription subunit 13 isoform X1 [Cryptomeria japonica]